MRRQYERDRFVRPSKADPRVLNAIEAAAFEAAEGFTPITPAPLAPLAACASVATVSQNKIVTTMRGSEVASDTSNWLALECAVRRAADPRGPAVALCASQRLVRAQALERPEFTAHFQLFATVMAGRDPGGRAFETDAIVRTIGVQLTLLRRLAERGFACGRLTVTLSPDATLTPIAERAATTLRSRFADVPVEIDGARIATSGYYRALCFGVWVHRDADRFPLGDGGFTDWVAKLTASRKERCLVGALGTEALATSSRPNDDRRHGTCVTASVRTCLVTLGLAMLALAGVPARCHADAVDLASTPAVRVEPAAPVYARRPPGRLVRGPITAAMHVWVLRGAGPAGRIEVLATLDLRVAGDADTAIDLLQTRAWSVHADAVIGVRIEHTADGATHVTGVAIRYV